MSIRGRISRRLLNRLEHHTSAFFRRAQIQILADLAADSFGRGKIRIRKGSPAKALKEYAAFTVSCMEAGPADPDRLFRDAARLGSRIRRASGLTDRSDLQKLVFLLYRNIDIEMTGNLPGEIVVSSCYFNRFYTPRQCRLMSCVDSGIVSGIFGGGQLVFSQRITDGCDRCVACLCKEENDHE